MNKGHIYLIKVQNQIGDEYTSWFEGMKIEQTASGEVLLCGRLDDQAALQGVLSKIRDLNLELVSVERLDEPDVECQSTSGSSDALSDPSQSARGKE